MPWSYRGLGVESEWRKRGFKKKAAGGGGRRRDVVTSARLLTQDAGNIYECSDDESAMAKKADGLDFEHVVVVGHKCWMFY